MLIKLAYHHKREALTSFHQYISLKNTTDTSSDLSLNMQVFENAPT